MRIRKTIKIDEQEFVVRELTVKEIINLFQEGVNKAATIEDTSDGDGTDSASLDFFKGELERFTSLALEGRHDIEDFYEMAPSDIDKLYTTFKEVNEVFFRIARSVGIDKILDELRGSILRDFSGLLVSSSKLDTWKRLTTGTPTSLPQ